MVFDEDQMKMKIKEDKAGIEKRHLGLCDRCELSLIPLFLIQSTGQWFVLLEVIKVTAKL